MTSILQRVGPRGTLRRNILSNGVGGVLTMAGQLAAVPLGLAVVGVQPYGAWATVAALAQYAAVFDLGIATATLRQVAMRVGRPTAALRSVLRASFRTMVALGVLVGVVVTAVVLALLPLLGPAMGVGATAHVGVALAVGSTSFAGLLGRHFQSVNQGAQRYDTERTHQVIAMAVRLVALALAWVLHWGIAGLVPIELLAIVLPGLLSAARIRRSVPAYSLRGSSRDGVAARSLLTFGLPWFWLNTTTQAVILLPTTIVGVLVGPTAAAAMAAASRIAQGTRQVLNWVLDPLVPAAAAERRQARRRIVPATRLLLVVSAGLVVPSIALAVPFMRWWLGDPGIAVTSAVFYIAIAVPTLVMVPHLVFNIVQIANGVPSFYLRETIVWGILSIGGLFPAAAGGRWGVAAALLLPTLLLEPVYLLRMFRVTGPVPGFAVVFANFGALVLPPVIATVLVEVWVAGLHLPHGGDLLACGAVFVLCTALTVAASRRARAALPGR